MREARPHHTSALCVPGGAWRDRRATVRDALGSVLNQLGSNPDLTRLSLPAVFQYPYSALELGAFRALRFSHLLIEASQCPDPVTRFARVLAYVLSNAEDEVLHKKPFNPVEGEELLCWVAHPDGSQTFFRAEQVSHHPPVSAFFLLNERHDVAFECNVELCPVFHGNSVSITSTGFGEVRLRGETYRLSLYIPTLRIENVVFGTRRQVWRGDWGLTCSNGLAADLVFSETKGRSGWFGGAEFQNEVAGTVTQGPERAVVATLSGTAGQTLVMQSARGKDTLLDFAVLRQQTQTLRFLPWHATPPTDSLRMWGDVVAHILVDDMRSADRAKVVVEENARKLRKERGDQPLALKYFRLDESTKQWRHTAAARDTTAVSAVPSTSILSSDTDLSTQTTTLKTEISDSEALI